MYRVKVGTGFSTIEIEGHRLTALLNTDSAVPNSPRTNGRDMDMTCRSRNGNGSKNGSHAVEARMKSGEGD